MNHYVQGQLVRVYMRFKDDDGALADPTSVTLKVENPAGTVSTYTYAGGHITKESTGVYFYDIDANQAGRWYYRTVGAGALQAAGQDSFMVTAARPA